MSLALFAAAEALIAVFGFGSEWLLYDVLYLELGHLAGSRAVTCLVLLACLLWPTFLMGVSLPLLARAVVGGLPSAPGTIGRLYGVNTLGAAMGALGATWMLMPTAGMGGSIRMAACINLLCAVAIVPAVFGMWRTPQAGIAAGQTKHSSAQGAASCRSPSVLRMGAWLAVYACSGFVALSLEIVWFRMLGVMQKSTAFSFGTLLAVYLSGVGSGALAGLRLAHRSQRPAAAFLLLQGAIGAYVGLVTAAFFAASSRLDALQTLHAYFGSYEPVDVNAAMEALRRWIQGTAGPEESNLVRVFTALYLGLPLLLVGPPTFLMGLSFPFLQRAVQTDLARIGRRVGWLQAANIAGCVIGAVLTGVCALATIGTAPTLRCLVAICAVFALAGIRRAASAERRKTAAVLQGAVVVVFGASLWLLPGQELLWARTHGTTDAGIVFGEDGSGVSAIRSPPQGGPTIVFANGIGQSWIPYGGVHSALGALPAMLHPSPAEIAVIGLGSGDTLFSLGGRPETRRIVCIEIIGAQLATLRRLAGTNPDPALAFLLDDPRIEHITGDGRLYLMHTTRKFDIIEADALRPTSAHSGNLYSDAYFRLLRSRLNPGGFAVTWCPTRRVLETFVRVFPHVLSFGDIVIGGNEPFTTTPAIIQARLADPAICAYYRRAGIEPSQLLQPYLGPDARPLLIGPDFNRATLTDINTDVFPKDEFSLPALWK
ncbi:MAG: spermidine synthase [Verrucomicrobia bacterium]|nr:spermidine synthase [Verrucomicrobiota bacterium]